MHELQRHRPDESTSSLGRAIRILAHLADNGSSVSIRELSAALGLPRSTVHRLCQLLAQNGMLTLDPSTKLYLWGPELLRIAHAVYQTSFVRQLALNVMQDVVRQCDETALLVVYDPRRRSIVFVDEVACSQTLRYHPALGVPQPVHAGASGKAILAFLPEEEIDAILASALERLTENTKVDPEEIRRSLPIIRARGYAVSTGERTPGAVGIACPILDGGAKVIGDLMVTIPEYRFSRETKARVLGALKPAAERLSRLLGYPIDAEYPPRLDRIATAAGQLATG